MRVCSFDHFFHFAVEHQFCTGCLEEECCTCHHELANRLKMLGCRDACEIIKYCWAYQIIKYCGRTEYVAIS